MLTVQNLCLAVNGWREASGPGALRMAAWALPFALFEYAWPPGSLDVPLQTWVSTGRKKIFLKV